MCLASHLKGKIDDGTVSLLFTNEFLLNWQPLISLRLRERGFVLVSNGLRKAKHLHVILCDWKGSVGLTPGSLR